MKKWLNYGNIEEWNPMENAEISILQLLNTEMSRSRNFMAYEEKA
jgi:hypothetical protein